MYTVCCDCGLEHHESVDYACRSCSGILLPAYEKTAATPLHETELNGIWKYHRYLPPVPKEYRVYMGEGTTPLIPSVSLGAKLGIGELYFKYEGGNPTGSYKDRIAAMGLSWARAAGRTACIGTTSGNAGAAVAAYAGRAGMPYHLYVLEHMAEAKLAQVLVHKAQVRKVKEFGTNPEVGELVFQRIFQAAVKRNWEVMITAYRYNPYAMEGVKTIAFELFEQLKGVPSHIYTPVGGGGLYCGIWKGFDELQADARSDGMPHLVAVQPEGCSNIVKAYKAGSPVPLDGPSSTSISGLQVPNPPDGKLVLQVMHKGGGSAVSVEDSMIWEAQELLAEQEGIFCEPAAAASVAGLIQTCRDGIDRSAMRIVCIVSGTGFKDSRRLSDMTQNLTVPCLEVSELDI
ncbi:pyridoxal-phosphate dependent enzyme [Paenibacillus sp. LMG 31456]|uniref:Pyridoxal-phosphate dependent enzyme n=1 Tax=Paenibacillus foliorum TaxID=2654974 RepID=A0A972H4G4_9BACL|nr:pyridoxal-phosphate dependent enzyme [Paenibacillus foliorum]NOU96151.1 pyridoxal-phosphate dependent enzyme [Paenibacillus foliorum]